MQLMGKYPVYAIMALVFVGIIKLLQVTAFDAEQYAKNKESSFSSYSDKTESTVKKKTVKSRSSVSKKQVEAQKEKPTSIENDTAKESKLNEANKVESQNKEIDYSENTSSYSENSEPNEPAINYRGFADLKNLYLAPLIANLPSGQLREDVVIRYYRHEKDGDKVFLLTDLGYYIHEKEATETAGLGSNVIYYGEDVNVEDIRIVAYSLLESGIPLKAISPTQFNWKSNSIEIGTDTLLLEIANLSESEIKNFQK